ncbi:hypothetical protein COT77_03125 [Candidatus Berkelbacteria bacterium CG10_big_fil_rev_8_21_14_0_10_41_12]|uniref:tRNA dimethylallyltransferase n=1 Tax=Candidatus Berkelbacteria bacterium CG10_big_fil_rev_8_21_14_0_10_41_12 TaxID=1974513 RepID=A0A2M6WWG9_9BACT|nr:MAG: hypothetical protein COT77_03125 [Candidatus Berkelbacteria bacterium CG10_big_fil_rev_8_21_14_0_10_41_12]
MNERKIIAIVGPTASGKTSLGVALAKKFGGEIISADSRQIYRGLDIGTAKEGILASAAEISNFSLDLARDRRKFPISKHSQRSKTPISNKVKKLSKNIRWIDGVPQWMIDIASTGEKFTMFNWLGLAREVIEDIFLRRNLPIVVGGTGLYVQALFEGFEINRQSVISGRQKKYSRKELEKMSLEKLQKIYRKLLVPPRRWLNVSRKPDLNNPYRLVRAIERAQSGEVMVKKKPDFQVLQIGINLPRNKLYERIDKRIDERFNEGMLEEVVGLIKLGVDRKWLLSLGLEYRVIGNFVVKYLDAEKFDKDIKSEIVDSKEYVTMVQELKYRSHAYARRQITWFGRFPEIVWVKNKDEARKIAGEFLIKSD